MITCTYVFVRSKRLKKERHFLLFYGIWGSIVLVFLVPLIISPRNHIWFSRNICIGAKPRYALEKRRGLNISLHTVYVLVWNLQNTQKKTRYRSIDSHWKGELIFLLGFFSLKLLTILYLKKLHVWNKRWL